MYAYYKFSIFLLLPIFRHSDGFLMQKFIGLISLYQSDMAVMPIPDTCIEDVNPTRTVVTCREFGILSTGSLRGCKATENCFSTSSKTATKKQQPWYYSQRNDLDAFDVLKDAAQLEGLTILKVKPDELYLLGAEKDIPKQPAGSSIFYEFLLKPEDKVVVYRGVVDKTVFLYPLQQPVSDFGVIVDKLNRIYKRTGFAKDSYDSTFDTVEAPLSLFFFK